jgi:hypothetical protein
MMKNKNLLIGAKVVLDYPNLWKNCDESFRRTAGNLLPIFAKEWRVKNNIGSDDWKEAQ